jgi:hypothetical protein
VKKGAVAAELSERLDVGRPGMFGGLLVPNISGSMGSDCGPLEGATAQKASRPRTLHVDGRAWIMNNVLSLQLAGERARQPRGGSNGHALSARNPQTTHCADQGRVGSQMHGRTPLPARPHPDTKGSKK